MKIKPLLLLAILASPIYASFAADSDPAIQLKKCVLSVTGIAISREAECGWLEVPEDPAKPDAKTIRLHVAIARGKTKNVRPDPVFFFAGGPGQAASDVYVTHGPIFEKILRKRDMIFIDQRGTGKSNKLNCELPDGDFDIEFNPQQTRDLAQDCLRELPGDPRFYTTTIAMQDYDKVREALGYEQINLYGISYGTRAAQVYLKQFPDRVRRLILDSNAPPQLVLGAEHAQMLDRTLTQVFEACTSDNQCNEQFPNLQQKLDALVQQLEAEPRQLSVKHPRTGIAEAITVNRFVLAGALRMLAYTSETQALIPFIIHEAATTGNLERIASRALMLSDGFLGQLALGMEASVICSEDFPYFPEQFDHSDYLLGDVMLESMIARCEVWPKGEAPADFHVPGEYPQPALILSGERDPVTPAAYGEQTAAQFSNGRHLIVPGQGHSVSVRGCLPKVVAKFLEAEEEPALDTSCVDTMQAAPYFTSLLGPEP